MKRGDILIIAAVLLVSLLPLILLFSGQEGSAAIVRQDGETLYELPLDVDASIPLQSEHGENQITVKDGAIYMESATCKDQSCVRQGRISSTGQIIACLPHGISITIKGEGGYDAITR